MNAARKLALVPLLAVVACAGGREQAKKDGDPASRGGAPLVQDAQPAAQSGASAQAGATAQGGATAAATGQGAKPQAGTQTAPPAAQGGQTPPTGTAPVAQAPGSATGAAPQSTTEPALMPDAEFRYKKPDPLAVQPHFEAPVPVERKLKNGARVLVVENHALPLVSVDVTLLHGVDADPKAKAGLAEFVADTVDEGTKSRSATKFAEELENLAAHLGTGASRETSNVHLNSLAETFPQALELLADAVQDPAFRKEDVDRVRVLKLTQLEQKKASIGALAADEAARILYGDEHPWGQPAGGTPESIRSIDSTDLAKFHATWWVPNNAVISVAGDVKPDEVVRLLEQKLGGWKSRPLPKLSLPAPPQLSSRISALDKPGATQSQVWVVGRLFPARDPDAIPFRVGNATLGGLFTSRLNMNLREQHGYSYGVRSGASLGRTQGTFTASGGIIAKNTVDAVGEYEKELRRFTTGDLTAEELAGAKEAIIRSIPSTLETNDAVATSMANLVSLGLPLDYYRTLPGRVQKVSREEVVRVAQKWIHPDRWPIVIVGPVSQSRDALAKLGFGPVEVKPAGGTVGAQPARPTSSAAPASSPKTAVAR